MSTTFNPFPELPPEVASAAESGELVVFVGAGISRLVGCPSWDGFATRVLEQLTPKCIDYYELSQINSIVDPKKRLSVAKIVAKKKRFKIDYASVFKVADEAENIYTYLNAFDCSFVTTNYEKHLSPISRSGHPEDQWRFFTRERLLAANLDQKGSVVHIHGCVDDPDGMIVTTTDYLNHYSSPEVREFLQDLFARKTILFLGYGLEEIELLEYIFRRGGVSDSGGDRVRRFVLQGFFNAEMALFELLREYYLEAFSTELIGFPKDYGNYAHQTKVLEAWCRNLIFEPLALADEVAAMEEEIRG